MQQSRRLALERHEQVARHGRGQMIERLGAFLQVERPHAEGDGEIVTGPARPGTGRGDGAGHAVQQRCPGLSPEALQRMQAEHVRSGPSQGVQ